MQSIPFQQFFDAVFNILAEKGKSDEIAELLIQIELSAPSLTNDLLTELSLTASSNEEVGSGCYSLEHLQRAYQEIKETGTTKLLEEAR